MTAAQKELLEKPVNDLSFSIDLKELLEFYKIDTLEIFVKKKIGYHRRKHGLTFQHELELFRFMKENGLREWWNE